jgi:hypothetical protein
MHTDTRKNRAVSISTRLSFSAVSLKMLAPGKCRAIFFAIRMSAALTQKLLRQTLVHGAAVGIFAHWPYLLTSTSEFEYG